MSAVGKPATLSKGEVSTVLRFPATTVARQVRDALLGNKIGTQGAFPFGVDTVLCGAG